MVTIAKYHTYGWYLSRPQISQINTDNLVASNSSHYASQQKTPKESKICDNLCNLWENSTFSIIF